MKAIGWFDPSLHSNNLGDQIIAESVGRVLSEELGPDTRIVRIPTQTRADRPKVEDLLQLDGFIVGGTNLLNADYLRYRQWKLDPMLMRLARRKTLLMGVGWWQYEERVTRITRSLWRYLLDGQSHSVRDTYTRDKLNSMGLTALNTSCPTTWQLPQRLDFGPRRTRAIVTITDYNRDPKRDRDMLRYLNDRYASVHLWPQGKHDSAYCQALAPKIQLLDASLSSFDKALDSHEFEYVGTRLHAGIRALQKGVRATIVSVDNRATEMGKDIGLPVLERASLNDGALEHHLTRHSLALTLPRAAIDTWRDYLKTFIGRV